MPKPLLKDTMDIKELIALASVRSGKKKATLADEMGHNDHTRISKIASGVAAPNSSEILYLAKQAHLPEIQTLAEIEAKANPHLAPMWQHYLTEAVSYFPDRRKPQRAPSAAVWRRPR
jgi:hypothetical protein